MEFTGTKKIKANQRQVFQALLTPEILKNSIPGCDAAELVDYPTGPQIKLVVSPNFPGLKGPYTIFIIPEEVNTPSSLVLVTEPSSSIGTIKARCAINLVAEGAETSLDYNATALIEGKLAATPEFVIKPAVKAALDHFFKNFDKQVSSITA